MKLTPTLLLLGVIVSLAHAQVSVVNDSAWSSPVANAYVGGSSGLNYYGSSSSSGNLSLTGDSANLLTLATGTSGRGLAVTFATQSLGSIGSSITAAATFQITGPLFTSTTNNFRIGLYDNSGGTAITANNFANTNNIFVGWNGYMAASSLDVADSTPSQIYEKVTDQIAIIGAVSISGPPAVTYLTSIGNGGIDLSPAQTPILAVATNYTASITITRIADGVNIAYTLTGGALGETFNFDLDDTTSATTAFNTFALHVNSNTWTSTQLQSLQISAIPEPSTYAAFAGLLALGFVAWRRRQAA